MVESIELFNIFELIYHFFQWSNGKHSVLLSKEAPFSIFQKFKSEVCQISQKKIIV